MAKGFPELIKCTNPQIQEIHLIPSNIARKKSRLGHIRVKPKQKENVTDKAKTKRKKGP